MIKRVVAFVVLLLGVSLLSAPSAFANHTLPLQARRNVIYQYMPNKVPVGWQTVINNRLQYLNNIPGHPINVVQGTCMTGFPCVRVYAEAYGNTGWLGLTTYANSCGTYLCTYNGSAGTWTTLQIDTSVADPLPSNQKYTLACHEIGHTVKLQHSSGTTCMQATIDSSPSNQVDHFLNSGGTVDTNEELELYDMYINGGVPL